MGPTTIAVAGKGGTGKTTIAALLIRRLVEMKAGAVLAIDADPSSNLNTLLGLPLHSTIGDIREETLQMISQGRFPAGMSKQDFLEYQINQNLVEAEGVDLLAMGRPEGPSCYCAANHVLRTCVDELSESYDYVIIDNEAGLEHLSRRTTRNVDILLIVSDATTRGLTAAARVRDLVKELKTKVGTMHLVVNRLPGDWKPALQAQIDELDLPLAKVFGFDPLVAENDALGRPISDLARDSSTYTRVAELMSDLGIGALRAASAH